MPQAVNPPVMYYKGTPYGLGGVTMVDKHSVMTMLYSRETGDSEDAITLSEDFDHFDLLVISGKAYITDGLWHQSSAYICDSLAVGNRVSIGDDGSISWFDIYDKTTLSRALDSGNPYQITHVMGVKFNGTTAGGGSSSDDYSTEEQEIGTWINNEPLYRKVFQITGQQYLTQTFQLQGIPSNAKLIKAEGTCSFTHGGVSYSYNLGDYSEYPADGDITAIKIWLGTVVADELELNLIIYYTKPSS